MKQLARIRRHFRSSILRRSVPWLSRSAVLLCLTMLSFIPVLGQAEDTVKFEVGLVTINVAVKDAKGRSVLGLRSEDFLITDENRRVIPEFFDEGGPASIVFVVDVSSSMKGNKWQSLMDGMKEFLSKAQAGNDYTLVSFDDSPHLIAKAVNGAELLTCLSRLRLGGNTALFDGLLKGLEELPGTPQHRRAVVLISDGEDTASKRSLAEVREAALAQRTTIYSVGILLEQDCRRKLAGNCDGRKTITQFSEATGGLSWFPQSEQLPKVLADIYRDVVGQYSLSYHVSDHRPGWRQVEVGLVSGERHSLRYQQRYLMR